MPIKEKCCHKVSIYNTNKFRSCKSSTFITINNKKYCWSHSNMIYRKSSEKIQSTFRSYICRKKIKNLFIDLPIEIKNIICYYIREEYYYTCYINKCTNILNNKINKINLDIINIYNNNNIEYQTKIINDLLIIYNLFNNNFQLINFDLIHDHDLIKLYMFTKYRHWAITTWNGIYLDKLLDIIYNNNSKNKYNFNIITNKFRSLWESKFIYYRNNLNSASIIIR